MLVFKILLFVLCLLCFVFLYRIWQCDCSYIEKLELAFIFFIAFCYTAIVAYLIIYLLALLFK